MGQDGGGFCCKCFLILSSAIFLMEGFGFVTYGVLLHNHEKQGHDSPFVWILIAQGALMVIMGTCGICCVCTKKRSGLKGFCVLLALLALADIIVAMVVYFKCKENCPTFLPDHFHSKPLAMVSFLGTAVLLIIALVCSTCLLKQKERVTVEFSARFSAKT